MGNGYDEGYLKCQCFWGRAPGSLVRQYLSQSPSVEGFRILDLGCGEGKNALAFAKAGAEITAVDSSEAALNNGQREMAHDSIKWVNCDAETYLKSCDTFDIVIMYGLLHCLASTKQISALVDRALRKTRKGGYHFVVTFNDGPQDFRAHPGFFPTLAPHSYYLNLYRHQRILFEEDDLIQETHPHNAIPHHHSLTRLIVRKTDEYMPR